MRTAMMSIGVSLLCWGCATGATVTRVVSPVDAADEKVEAVAVIRDGERLVLPKGTHVRSGRVVFARGESASVSLDREDEVVHDEDGRITGVRAGTTHAITRFVSGTAELVGSREVRGELETMPLRKTDDVEVYGHLSPGDAIPGGGHVESSRWTGALVLGATLFAISYGPSAYVASQSPSDRALFAPLAGPWIDLVNRPSCTPAKLPVSIASFGIDSCIGDTATRVALVASGAVQALGALFVLIGLPTHTELYGDHGVHVSIAPTGPGVAAFGTF